jgi:hypothetical protein
MSRRVARFSLSFAHTPVLPEVSLLNCTLQDTATSLHFIRFFLHLPHLNAAAHNIYYILIILGFLNDASKTIQYTTSTGRMIGK